MDDFRILAHNLINYSCALKPGEKVLIEGVGFEKPLTIALVEEAYKVGAIPFVTSKDPQITRAIIKNATKEQMEMMAKYEAERMNDMDAYIGIRSGANSFEFAGIPQERMDLYNKYYMTPVHHQIRVPKTKWVVLRYPNEGMAQLAQMPTDEFRQFYFDVCNLDYAKMSEAMKPLVELMNKTDKVHLVGENLDLRFSIKDIPAIPCDGKCNIPDGEVYTAPVRDSVNGHITYNMPTLCQGTTFNNVTFHFENGKIVKAEAGENTEKLNKILDSDEGARYIGEFAIGVNPYVNRPILDTLFDEKIYGSFHFTPGNCYDDAYNGNQSVIHWDIVFNQTEAYGGGDIYFDDVLIRHNGEFVLPELQPLNKASYEEEK